MYKHLCILIACEESQAECMAFRELGHEAYSCDIQLCNRKKHPEWHIPSDVRRLLKGAKTFQTQDGKFHIIKKWDLIIAHPPCTYLCKLSSVHMTKNADTWVTTKKGPKYINFERWRKLLDAKRFFFECLNAAANYVAVENPIPMAIADLPKPTCYACPSWYGVKYTKKTLYWLKNLPPLFASAAFSNPVSFVKRSRGKYRSRTFTALANAIAKQWSTYILNDMKKKGIRKKK